MNRRSLPVRALKEALRRQLASRAVRIFDQRLDRRVLTRGLCLESRSDSGARKNTRSASDKGRYRLVALGLLALRAAALFILGCIHHLPSFELSHSSREQPQSAQGTYRSGAGGAIRRSGGTDKDAADAARTHAAGAGHQPRPADQAPRRRRAGHHRVGTQHEGGIGDLTVLVRSRTTKPTFRGAAHRNRHTPGSSGGADTGALRGSPEDERAFGYAPKNVFRLTVVLPTGCFILRPTVGATDSKPAARAVEMSS